MIRRRVPSLAVLAGLVLATACAPEQAAVSPPATQAPGAAPAAAAVNASVQRALAEAARAREAAQRAEAAARRARDLAAMAEAAAPSARVAEPGKALLQGERPDPARTTSAVASYPDGSRYEGEFTGTVRNGVGVYVTREGVRYAGEWRGDAMSGHGSVTRANSLDRYDGEWRGAQREGHGVQVEASGDRYVGAFHANRPHGLGALYDAQGKPKAAGAWGTTRQADAAPSPAPRPANFGSGFVVATRGTILTNEHVVRGCTRIEAREAEGAFMPATLLRADAASDLAVIDVDRPLAAAASFREAPALREGEEIVVYGFPFAAQMSPGGTVTSGIVSSLFGPGGAGHQLQVTAPVQIGNSGGPLLDRQGRVVGVVQSKLNALSVAQVTGDVPQNVNFAVKSANATALLRAAGVTPAAAPAQAGEKRIVDIAEVAKRFTVLIRCER